MKQFCCIFSCVRLFKDYFSSEPERTKMIKDLCDMAIRGTFSTPDCEIFQLKDYENALQNSVKPFTKKSLFVIKSQET